MAKKPSDVLACSECFRKLEKLWRKRHPTTAWELVSLFAGVEHLDQMRRWGGMPEHPAVTRARLIEAKQWSFGYRVYRSELSKSRVQDRERAAFDQVQKLWEPLPDAVKMPDSLALEQLWKSVEKQKAGPVLSESDGSADLSADTVWVYRHMNDIYAPSKAPNPGAAVLWQYAKANPTEFIKTMIPLAMRDMQKRTVVQEGPSVEEKRAIENVQAMIEAAVEASQRVA